MDSIRLTLKRSSPPFACFGIADDRFDEHQAELAERRVKKATGKATQSAKKNKGKRR